MKGWKKSWEPFGRFLLNSTANPAHFHPSLAGLAVLFSRQLPNGSHDFFQTFSIFFSNYFIGNPQTTIALAFLTHNISAIGGVDCVRKHIYCQHFTGPNLQFVHLMSLLSLHCWIEIAYLLSVARNAMISAAILQHNADRLCEEEHLVFTRWPFVFLTTEGSSESEKNHIWKKKI